MQDREAAELEALGADVVERARRAGAEVAEVSARRGFDLSVRVRLGNTELVEEAGQRGLSLRVISGQRVALASTSDFTEAGIRRLVADAIELASLSEPDPFAGPADPSELCSAPHPDLDQYDPRIAEIAAGEAIGVALACEKAALGSDQRITLSEGATFSRSTGVSAMVLSSGFSATQRGSYASLSVAPVVEDEGGKKRRGHYWTASCYRDGLEPAEAVGQEAARRTLRKLGARKVPTTETPVVFDPDVSRSLLSAFAGCIMGGAIWRKSSYLVEREGTVVASPLVTIVDDPLIPRAFGSRAFDGEGLRSRRNVVVDGGTLKTFLLDSYSARKLNKRSTASAVRSGGVGPSTSNFILQAGAMSAEELIQNTASGLYVTEMMGFGFNALTGDFSRGAGGFWIENGKFAFPVSEVTLSSNLDAMLKGIDAIASDLVLKTSTAAPTLRVNRMTLSGT
ncbi:MAG TPA: TldD/PmbA family protein [Polyangiaceae bacterium]|nr:TldD/PmbA family protein [Polyangiaceae bacterium]